MSEQRPLVTNAASVKQVKEAKRKERLSDLERKEDLIAVMSTLNGRRFVWSLLQDCRMFSSCFDINPHLTDYFEGRRDIGIQILERIDEHCPELFDRMKVEARKKEG